MSIFSGRHYPKDVILWAVRWYCRYGVSYRDLEEMLTERGAAVDHTTIYRWVQKYGPEMDKRTRWYRKTSPWFPDSWRVDETYIKVGGKWCYLYRAVTKDGDTLDFYMSTKRNTEAAKRFLGKALRGAGHRGPDGGPRVICTDKAPTYAAAIKELIEDEKLSKNVVHRQVKYLNNVIEGDHGRLKRILGPKGGGFKNPVSAYRTLKGMEAMHALRKGQGSVFAYGQPNPDESDRDQSLRQRLKSGSRFRNRLSWPPFRHRQPQIATAPPGTSGRPESQAARIFQLEAELADAQAEARKLAEERDILRQAAKYFAGETSW